MKLKERSQGSYLLARTGKTQQVLARALGVSQQVVGFWLSGARVPGLANRKQMLAKYKIPIESWDTRHITATSPPTAKPDVQWGDSTVAARIDRLQSIVDQGLTDLQGDGGEDGMTPLERARVMGELAKAIGQLRRLRGEEVTELQILKHPKWLEIQTAVLAELDDSTVKKVLAKLEVAGR